LVRTPDVTFVIASYKRVDALRCTLRSLLLQQHQDWTAVVIGDHCGPETAEAIRSFGERRIRYYNLPERFGEQSGPNTAGLHLAESDFVSFLNHDDLLLPDHLSRARTLLAERTGDFYIGRFANATQLGRDDNGAVVPVFTEILPAHEDLRAMLASDPFTFDPSSFWLVRTEYARAIGPWLPARRLRRTPLRDWLMRAWRRGGTFVFGDTITGLRFWTQNLRTGAPLYTHATEEHEYMIARLERESPENIRASILQRIGPAPPEQQQGGTLRAARRHAGRSLRAVRSSVQSHLYLQCNIDLVSLGQRLSRRQPAEVLNALSRRRTGQDLPAEPTIETFLRNPEAHRVL
jgi:glycosyltransferase involved in cell wall biosynthesis